MIKKIFFYFVLACCSYFVLEISAFSLYFIITHKFFIFPKYSLVKEDINIPDLENDRSGLMNIHPYLGFVRTPGGRDKELISDFGFEESKSPIQSRSDDKIVIGIFGGSLASQLGRGGIGAIEAKLKKFKFYNNKKFIFLTLGMGGYKQPQQLLTLNYLLALGGAFDIVINLDGFNDIALPVTDNIPHHVFPFFPRSWPVMVSTQAVNYDNIRIIYEANAYKRSQERLARTFSSFPLRYSIAANLFFDGINHYLSNEISKRRLAILNEKNDSKSYTVTGPVRTYKNDKQMYEDLAMFWKNSSLLMSKICASNHIKYFHFLQPNQYVPNSKIIKEEEAKIAISKGNPYQKPVEEGYPYLRQAGEGLLKEGVNFSDLTYVFAHNDETLYMDTCCHLNPKGLSLLGQIIGETIDKDMQKSSEVPADFDWQQYVANYSDLQRAGTNTRKKAEDHWMQFGYFENRSYRKKVDRQQDHHFSSSVNIL